jgi:hygromycin-B 7''-O-kinase
MKNSLNIFPEINTDEEYEKFKLNNSELCKKVALEIVTQHHLPDAPLSPLDGTNIVFSHGKSRIIKIFPPLHKSHFDNEVLTMKYLHNKLSVVTPKIEYVGEIDHWPYIIMSQQEGTLLEGLWEKLDHSNKIIIIRELGSLIHEVHSLPTEGLEAIDCHWKEFINKQLNQCIARHQETGLPDLLLKNIPTYLDSIKDVLPIIKKSVILTGEYTPMNFLVKQEAGIWHIHGLIDFGDSMLGLPEYDLLGPGAFLIQGDKILLREFLSSYGYSPSEMTSALSHKLTALMLLHRYSRLNMQVRIDGWEKKVKSLDDLEKLVWGF